MGLNSQVVPALWKRSAGGAGSPAGRDAPGGDGQEPPDTQLPVNPLGSGTGPAAGRRWMEDSAPAPQCTKSSCAGPGNGRAGVPTLAADNTRCFPHPPDSVTGCN